MNFSQFRCRTVKSIDIEVAKFQPEKVGLSAIFDSVTYRQEEQKSPP